MTKIAPAGTRPQPPRRLSEIVVSFTAPFERDLGFAFGLLLLLLLAYGLQAVRLGFYWDDWQMVYLTQAGRPEIYWRHWLYDRPFVSWIYWVTTHLVQFSPLRSQVLTILIRWLGALGCYQAFRLAWPAFRWQARWVAVLLLLFPGFVQQSVSFTYGAHFSTFALFAGSLACMVAGLRRPARFWALHPPGLAAGIAARLFDGVLHWTGAGPPGTALAVGLQDQGENARQTLRRALRLWLPYLSILVLFAVWRVGIFPGLTDPSSLSVPTILLMIRQDPLDGLVELLQVASAICST